MTISLHNTTFFWNKITSRPFGGNIELWEREKHGERREREIYEIASKERKRGYRGLKEHKREGRERERAPKERESETQNDYFTP